MLVTVASGESLPLEQVKRLFGEWLSAAAVDTELMELYFLSPAALCQPHQRNGEKHTHTPSSLACCSQVGCNRLALPLTMSFNGPMGDVGETQCGPSWPGWLWVITDMNILNLQQDSWGSLLEGFDAHCHGESGWLLRRDTDPHSSLSQLQT